MTDQDFEKIAAAIKASYPNSKVLPDKYAMKIWYQALADLDYKVAENAVWEHINTSVFPPSIAEIREKCAARLFPMVTDWGEAWEEVQTAIRKFGSYREEAALASLSRLTATAVRRMGYQNLCRSENAMADRAHFQRMYEGMVKEERRQTQLPEFVKVEREQMIQHNAYPVLEVGIQDEEPSVDNSAPSQEYVGKVEKLVNGLKRKLLYGE